MSMSSKDELRFAKEEGETVSFSLEQAEWSVLIVDDEQDVHESTILALGREKICGRTLRFDHAYSSAEAKSYLTGSTEYAVILLDVVMESEHAGLELVQYIREDIALLNTRIILRTGQPGYAPELETISKYEINDYKAKSELTRNKLFTSLTAAIRSYAQIRALELSKKGLETIINASKELLYLRGYQEFASGVITQLAGIFHLPEEGLVCVKRFGNRQQEDDLHIVAAAGVLRDYMMKPLKELEHSKVVSSILESAQSKENIFGETQTCLYFSTPDETEMIVYLAAGIETKAQELQMLELFSTNIAACIDNVTLLEQRHEYAYRDQLLGIPNRLSFLQSIEHHLTRQTEGLQVILIDIDQFGALNDTIGTENGDLLLIQISKRLRQHHSDQLVARISGDTFGILGEKDGFSTESVAACFNHAYEANQVEHMVSATQGRVDVGDQKAATEVLAQANVALKRAKQTLRGGHLDFHRDMLKETESRVHLLQNLRQAFDRDRLFMVYQPKIRLSDGSITGFEALMRWRTDSGDFVPPLDFIPIAENSGLIVPLGEWALRASLLKIKQLRDALKMDLTVAVNVSVVQFAQPDFVSMLTEAINFAEVRPEWLELEITESVAMQDFESVSKLIGQIHDLGVRMSIDDFGTGFSSLSYLEKLKVHSLKIDKSFVDRIGAEDGDTSLPETILRLGKGLGLQVVAEGVESEAQATWLREKGCDLAQGYHFAKPIPRDDIEAWVTQYS